MAQKCCFESRNLVMKSMFLGQNRRFKSFLAQICSVKIYSLKQAQTVFLGRDRHFKSHFDYNIAFISDNSDLRKNRRLAFQLAEMCSFKFLEPLGRRNSVFLFKSTYYVAFDPNVQFSVWNASCSENGLLRQNWLLKSHLAEICNFKSLQLAVASICFR